MVGQELGNRLIPGHATGLLKTLASPISVTSGNGVLSCRHQRSRIGGQFPGKSEAHGGISAQAHVTAPAGQGEAIYPAPGAGLGYLQIQPAAVMQIARFFGAADRNG